jgi:hypothetical protein
MTTKGDYKIDDFSVLDKQIETLMECKPLSESEVKQLCESVKKVHDSGVECVGDAGPSDNLG